MEIHLPPDLQDYLDQKLSSGEYTSAVDVLADALYLLRDRDYLHLAKLEELRKEIAIGVEQMERGEHSPVEPDLLEKIKARVLERRLREKRRGVV